MKSGSLGPGRTTGFGQSWEGAEEDDGGQTMCWRRIAEAVLQGRVARAREHNNEGRDGKCGAISMTAFLDRRKSIPQTTISQHQHLGSSLPASARGIESDRSNDKWIKVPRGRTKSSADKAKPRESMRNAGTNLFALALACSVGSGSRRCIRIAPGEDVGATRSDEKDVDRQEEPPDWDSGHVFVARHVASVRVWLKEKRR